MQAHFKASHNPVAARSALTRGVHQAKQPARCCHGAEAGTPAVELKPLPLGGGLRSSRLLASGLKPLLPLHFRQKVVQFNRVRAAAANL